MALEFAQELQKSGILKKSLSSICSIDSTFTGHSIDIKRSYNPVGSRGPKLKNEISRFTNCLVTCIWADGKNDTHPMLFTVDPLFRTDPSSIVK